MTQKNSLIEDYGDCDDDMVDSLYDGLQEGGIEAVETAISIDRGDFEHPHNVLEALLNLQPLIKVLEKHVAANSD